jgi:peptidoglycan/xylan/chitin deacetylase (PgdA/CDA1 family)
MELPTTADEGEPGTNRNRLMKMLFIVFCSLLIFPACRQSNKEPATPPPPAHHQADSILKKRQDERKADSLAAIKKAVPKKKIYLTFDDGPNKGTQNVLQAIKEENVAVSFFIVGKHVFDSPQQTATWQALKADSSIELCNHSYTHALNRYTKFYENPAGVVDDFKKSQEKLQFDNNVARMPGRNAWRIDSIHVTDIKQSRAAIDSVHQAGFDIMGWDIEWSFDHKTFAPDTATGILLRRIKNPGHLVLLAHDQAFQKDEYIAALHLFIQELKSNEDYEFVVASKYPGVRQK